jgi:hypothetical protein
MGGTDRKMALAGPAVVLRWKMRRPEKFQDAAASTCVLPSAGPYGKVVSGRLWSVVGWEVTRGCHDCKYNISGGWFLWLLGALGHAGLAGLVGLL